VLIAIHRGSDDRDGYADGWAECLAARGVDVRWLDLTAQDALHQVQKCDGVMWHWSHTYKDNRVYRILNVLELNLGIPVFPNNYSSWHRRDKLAQYYLFQAAGVPMPKTWIFRDKQRARAWALQTDYPRVFKLSSGGGGWNVVLVSSSEAACQLIDDMFGPGIYSGQIEQHLTGDLPRNWPQLRALAGRCKAAARYVARGQPPSQRRLEQGYVYFQEFIPANDYKTGVAVVGDRAFGSLSFNRTDDFRTHGETLDDDPSHVDLKCIQMAFDISERLGFHFAGYDFLLYDGEPVVLEMDFRNGQPRGYWKRNLEWVSEPMSPQEAQVETFLSSIRCSKGKLGTTPIQQGNLASSSMDSLA
jgi:glutathione synthase/RimK-type ligase-like ATP-grasp enzyme